MSYATLEVNTECDHQSPIFLAQFENGRLKQVEGQSCKFASFKNSDDKNPRKQHDRILVAETENMTYVGQNFGHWSAQSANLCKYYVGVLSKRTGKMRLIEAQMMHMRPQVIRDEDVKEQVDNLHVDDEEELTYREKRNMLTGAFGMSKRHKDLELRQKYAIKTDALEISLGGIVDQALSGPSAQALITSLETRESMASTVLPRCNRDAEAVADVYQLNDIISPTQLDSLKLASEPFINYTQAQMSGWWKTELYYKYVLNQVKVLPVTPEARSHKACLAMFLQYMLTMYHMKATDFRRKAPLPVDWPQLITKTFLEQFTMKVGSEGNKRCMPAQLKDKLLAHILVLCLIVDEFHLHMEQLIQDLKTPQKRLILVLQEIGCKVTTTNEKDVDGHSKSVIIATLTIPLFTPQSRTPKSLKSRR